MGAHPGKGKKDKKLWTGEGPGWVMENLGGPLKGSLIMGIRTKKAPSQYGWSAGKK